MQGRDCETHCISKSTPKATTLWTGSNSVVYDEDGSGGRNPQI